MTYLIINTDGASRGNPGQASYGFVVQDGQKKVLYEEGERLGVATNNVAEYTAVLRALEYVEKKYDAKKTKIDIVSDSQLVASQLSGIYKIKSPHLFQIFIKIKKLQKNFSEVSFRHVLRTENVLADRMANLALDHPVPDGRG